MKQIIKDHNGVVVQFMKNKASFNHLKDMHDCMPPRGGIPVFRPAFSPIPAISMVSAVHGVRHCIFNSFNPLLPKRFDLLYLYLIYSFLRNKCYKQLTLTF